MEVTEIFGMLGTPSLGRVCVADSPQTRSYLIRPNLAALGQTVWAQVRGPKKLWGCGAPPQWDAGAPGHDSHLGNMLLYNVRYHAESGISRSNNTSVINENPPEEFDPHIPPFGVIQGHWNGHGSISHL